MADFSTQVTALTGVSIGSDPTTTQLGIYLRDGVTEVTNRYLQFKPEEFSKFMRTANLTGFNSARELEGANIVTVVREDGVTDDSWRDCRFITPNLQYRVTDKHSMHYASKYNPAYMISDDHNLEVFPIPGGSPDRAKVYYINNRPVNSSGSELSSSDDEIRYFPNELIYLVIIFAGIKTLDKVVNSAQDVPDNLSNIVIISPTVPTAPTLSVQSLTFTQAAPTYVTPAINFASTPGISDLSIAVAVPSTPTLSTNSLSFSQTVPSYSGPVVNLESKPSISDLSVSATPPSVPVLSDNSLTFTQTVPTYMPPTASLDFSDANTWINTEEDSEMAAARMQVIGGQIQEYQANIQNNLNKFNEENAAYQIEFQKATQNAQLSSGDDNQRIQHFQAEVASYQAQVSQEVQEFTNNLNKELQLWQGNRQTVIQKYQADIQNSLNSFNKENAEYQIEFQRATQDAQLSSGDDNQKVQKYQAEIASYQAQVAQQVQEYTQNLNKELQLFQGDRQTSTQKYQADIQNNLNKFNKENAEYQIEFQRATQNAGFLSKDDDQAIAKYQAELTSYTSQINNEVQKIAKLNAEVQKYQAQIQKVKLDIDLYHQRSMKLQQQYDAAFSILAPQKGQQQQQQQQTRRRR